MQGINVSELKKLYAKGFPADTENYIEFFFDRIVNPNNILVYNTNGITVSAGYIVEKPAVIFGEKTVFPYVTALSTLPEYRGKGNIKFVLQKAFDVLRSRNYAFFGLHPFDYDYYKRFRLANISYACHSTVSGGENYVVKDYREEDFGRIKEIYDEMSSKFANKLLLTENTFASKVEEYAVDGISCKLLYDNGECFAFAFVDKRNIDFYATTDISKFSRAEYFKGFSYSDFFKKTEPYLQGRIVDARSALEKYYTAYPPQEPICLSVTDEFIKENNICVRVENINGKTVVKDADIAENTYGIDELTAKIFSSANNFFPDKY